jgi:hypothetical protein
VTGRLWTYVRDDRPFGGSDPPAAMFFYSRDRGGEHRRRHLLGWAGILQADAYAGFGELYEARRSPRPITEAACWAHGRRKFFVLADLRQVPLAIEALRRIDEVLAVEREINGAGSEQRHAVRQERIEPLVTALEGWMRTERARLSRHADAAKAIDYMLRRGSSSPDPRRSRKNAVPYGGTDGSNPSPSSGESSTNHRRSRESVDPPGCRLYHGHWPLVFAEVP